MIKRMIEIISVPVVQVMLRSGMPMAGSGTGCLRRPASLAWSVYLAGGAVLERCEIWKVSSWDMPWEERETRGK
jgi:hypothetical protein